MRRARTLLLAALAAAAAFGGITLLALEGRGIAVLRTQAPQGIERRTRVWFAESDGALWVESATSSRPFYLDLEADARVTVEIRPSPFFSEASIVHGRAELIAEPGGHERIRSLLANRYGWADDWIALLQDTSGSRAVRIVPDRDEAGSTVQD